MSRIRLASALAVFALLTAACGPSEGPASPSSLSSTSPSSSGPAAIGGNEFPPLPNPRPTAAASASPGVTATAPLALLVPRNVVFVGDRVSMSVTDTVPGGTAPRLSSVTVDFGDGTRSTTTSACKSALDVVHVYGQQGDYAATLTAAVSCAPTAVVDAAEASARIHVFPSATAESARWPVCSAFDVHLAGPWTGAGLGNVATLITLQNVSDKGCRLEGYPSVVLVGADGRPLPTHVRAAMTGAYLFPAVVPHPVGLAPAAFASFMIAYTDNPFGPDANAPYDVACPPSNAVRVILPGTHQFGTARVPMGVCGGQVAVSPVVPGSDRLRFY